MDYIFTDKSGIVPKRSIITLSIKTKTEKADLSELGNATAWF